MISMDDCTNVHPNFTLDEDLQPFSVAPGNVADIEVEYNESFVALVEVTMSQGARQYDSESEPVTRHIGRYQSVEKRRQSPRPVYGLFVAPRIDSTTRHYFYVHIKHLDNPEFGGYLNIVPLSVGQFVDVFLFCRSLTGFTRSTLQDLFERIVGLKHSTQSAVEWEGKIPAEIDDWKHHWQALSAAGQVPSHDTTARSLTSDSPVSRQ